MKQGPATGTAVSGLGFGGGIQGLDPDGPALRHSACSHREGVCELQRPLTKHLRVSVALLGSVGVIARLQGCPTCWAACRVPCMMCRSPGLGGTDPL